MSDPVSVVLVGIGGYGEVYLSPLLDHPLGRECRIVGAVDPRPEACSRLGELAALGVPIYPALGDFYGDHRADLAVISSPIQLHAEHTCMALERGSHVLVEKPVAGVTGEVDRMIQARDRAGLFVAVGFQWSFADSVLRLKRDILAGDFGAPLHGRALTLWPRTESYYGRNDWAGKKRDGEGRWILDSPANNAMAHHLHNLLFLLGPEMDRSAEAEVLDVRLARLNEIETFDTVAARLATAGGAELLFLASHTIQDPETHDPAFTLRFQEGTLDFPGGMAPMSVRLRDGRIREYPAPDATSQVEKLWVCAEAVRRERPAPMDPGEGSGSGPSHLRPLIPCGLETARPHTAFIEGLEIQGPEPILIPPELARISETPAGRLHWVEGMAASLQRSFDTGEMPVFF